MAKTLLKICGITNVKDALLVEKLGADIIGMIFAESPRKITVSKAEKISNALKLSTKKAGIFVNEKVNKVNEAIKILKLNYVQLHGNESPQYIKKIKGAKVIKTIAIKNRKQVIRDVNKYKNSAHFLLFDTFDDKKSGGTGKSFNWGVIKDVKMPYFIAGGIGVHNVEEVVLRIAPYGVDVNSKVEIYPGKKSAKKLTAFFNKIMTIRNSR
ncbi:MAG: phosphoribosylanthranilate isomerase [Candidatus Goldbacteria bacterium]|nr:phosphoribosylanthranilate isomerase [Candidatus Goldiibacteriota bacterium]HPD19253.1 phosphoribosylanthranilate isomerase [Candidatus Goldiibacteriota bacterium]